MIAKNLKLKVGMVFKNYKDLCNYLNEQKKGEEIVELVNLKGGKDFSLGIKLVVN
ncbi:hypothetical protein LGL08_19570 [Clostridium estertheticum]|uniref:hypothetical protein n=1 Tax=Clostridium estertheticum TaxID=238834 RepID=UPI001CF4C331|nr:hypothetical protein [Clostridium estertheticum]MCB2308718.1 hypothetical protein [Clostridium estertheticum]MCB2347447.1 hypothetical protein [Clostridium estertheticum]MCB2351728.1 hypothetical protein [Clostridium estertheticum]WAG46307.1 hypothetical protein LL127_01710 [Clostridium estertheticum]